MLVYRIQKAQHAATCLTCEGARLYGGRWNRPGVALVYAAATPELALLETLVHLDGTPLSRLPPYVLVTLALPDDAVEVIAPTDLPVEWGPYAVSAGRAGFSAAAPAGGLPSAGVRRA